DHRVGGRGDLPRHRDGRPVRHLLRLDRDVTMAMTNGKAANGSRDVVIEARGVEVGFGDRLVLKGADLDVYRGEILGFVGGSGAGKSVLMRTIIGLIKKQAGTIKVFGTDLDKVSVEERQAIERRWGVLFQQGALFSSL